MSRFDNVGLFWQDLPSQGRKRAATVRPMPPIPETGWRPPAYYPNLSAARVLSVDVEAYDPELDTNGPFWARGKGYICGFSVGTGDGYRGYFPIRHTVEPEMNLNPDRALAWLRDTLSNPLQPKVGANLIYDVGALRSEGIEVAGELVDVQFAEALLDERALVNLEVLSRKYLGEGKVAEVVKQWCKDFYGTSDKVWRKDLYRAPPRLVGPYGEGDADLPIRLAPILHEKLASQGLVDLFRMECELIRLLVDMRYAGVTVDIEEATQLRDELEGEATRLNRELDNLAGVQVSVNAPASIVKAFDKVGLPYPRTKGGKPSFKKDYLEKLDHPVPKLITEIRHLHKIRGTFLESYILNSNVNGKIYCSFHPLRGDDGGTRSGRFSSSNPNLQNIPVRSELGKKVRRAFTIDPGHERWRKYDYSQIEYRFLVHYAVGPGSDEARLRYITNPATDYHAFTQELIEKELNQKLDRRPVKNVNFGLVFGMGEEKLAHDLKLGEKAAKHFLEAYHRGVPFVKPTMRWAMNQASSTGVIQTILGRRSRFDLWEPDSWGRGDEDRAPALPYGEAILHYGKVKRAYQHKALNRLLQGSAADLAKMAMLKCYKSGVFAVTGVPRLMVHDELDFSDPGGHVVDEAFREMRHIMETAIPLRIPVLAGLDVGPNWGGVKEVA